MSRPVSVASSHLHSGHSVARTVAALATAAALTIVSACGHEPTQPDEDEARAMASGDADRLSLAGDPMLMLKETAASFWNGRVVAFQNSQRNSANQEVCLDIPWGVASVNQDVNYFPCHYGPAQQFVITAWSADTLGNSWVMIRPVSSNAVCLDVRGGGTQGGEHMQLFTCKVRNSLAANNQTFKLPRAKNDSTALGVFRSVICTRGDSTLVIEAPLPMAVTSFAQQGKIAPPASNYNQQWYVKDIQSGHLLRTANAAGQSQATC